MEQPPAAEPSTPWVRRCPHCQAEVQEASRRCWKCGGDIPAADFDDSDYRPSGVEPDAVEGISASLVVVLIFAIPLLLLGWFVYVLLVQFWNFGF